jgi:hypothetical protein
MFASRMKLEQRHTEGRLLQLEQGRGQTNSSQKTQRRQAALKRLVEDYDNRPRLEYLRGCGYNVNLAGINPNIRNNEEDDD